MQEEVDEQCALFRRADRDLDAFSFNLEWPEHPELGRAHRTILRGSTDPRPAGANVAEHRPREDHMLRTAIVGIAAVVVRRTRGLDIVGRTPDESRRLRGNAVREWDGGAHESRSTQGRRDRQERPRDLVVWNGQSAEHAPVRDQGGRNLQRVQQHRHADGVVVRRQIRLPEAGPRSASPEHDLRRQGRHTQPRTQGITRDELRVRARRPRHVGDLP